MEQIMRIVGINPDGNKVIWMTQGEMKQMIVLGTDAYELYGRNMKYDIQ